MGRGKGVFRREAVLYRNDPAAAVIRQLAQLIIVSGESAADKAAAVIVNDAGQRAGGIKWGDATQLYSFKLQLFDLYAGFRLSGEGRAGEIAGPAFGNAFFPRRGATCCDKCFNLLAIPSSSAIFSSLYCMYVHSYSLKFHGRK
jgi:hypothetical protein